MCSQKWFPISKPLDGNRIFPHVALLPSDLPIVVRTIFKINHSECIRFCFESKNISWLKIIVRKTDGTVHCDQCFPEMTGPNGHRWDDRWLNDLLQFFEFGRKITYGTQLLINMSILFDFEFRQIRGKISDVSKSGASDEYGWKRTVERTVRLCAKARWALWREACLSGAILPTIDPSSSRLPVHELRRLTTIPPTRKIRGQEWGEKTNTSTNSSTRPSGKIPWMCGPSFRSDRTVQMTLSIRRVPRCFWWASP